MARRARTEVEGRRVERQRVEVRGAVRRAERDRAATEYTILSRQGERRGRGRKEWLRARQV